MKKRLESLRKRAKILAEAAAAARQRLAFVMMSQCLPANERGQTTSFKLAPHSDSRVYDIVNYDVNSFDIGSGHKCSGTEISLYLQIGDRES